jgi:thiaminase/transcriptional activator TenA
MEEGFDVAIRAGHLPGSTLGRTVLQGAVGHRFVRELFAGAVPDAVMARYLIQDHRFLDRFLTLLGATLANADTFEARVRFGRFIGTVSGEENTFFSARSRRSASRRTGARPIPIRSRPPASRRSCARPQKRAAMPPRFRSSSWPEWLYLDWASRAPKPLPDNFVHAEWIKLHDNPDFRDFVDFLRAELDRIGPARRFVPRLFPSLCRPRTLLL